MAEALLIGGTLVEAAGTISGARSEAKQLKSQAAQLEANAGLERASSQREAIEQRRQSRLAQSRALALAAASGGGASDPTVTNIIADLEGEGEYRALSSLYEGNERAIGLENDAKARRKEAKNVKKASYFKAASSILKGGSSFAERYG